MSGGGGGGGQNTTVSQVAIPPFEQQFSQQNQQLAQALGQNPYPLYQGQLIAGFTPAQTAAMNAVPGIAGSYQPNLNASQDILSQALQSGAYGANQGGQMIGQGVSAGTQGLGQAGGMINPSIMEGMSGVQGGQQGLGAAGGLVNQALGQSANDPGVVASYMNPYVSAALQPQIQALQGQLANQQMGINQQATQAGAFGDSRQGVESSLANYYGDQSLNNLLGQGYGAAYQSALGAAQNQQQLGLQGANQLGNLSNLYGQLGLSGGQLGLQGAGQQANIASLLGQLGINGGSALGNLALNAGNFGMQGAQGEAGLGQLQQQLGLTGANALYNTGQLQQQNQQQALNTAYQQFMNQALWPYQQLSVQESALSNSPYNISTMTTLPNANMTAQGIGAFTGVAGALGSLLGGGSGSGGAGGGGGGGVFGGQAPP
jgi:hypothetical protein